jgi:predicted DNA-binding transcriptional regulator YafY
VNVWDVNAQGWRSFRYDRVQKVEPEEVLENTGH